MHNYYCRNCRYVVGKWNTKYKYYYSLKDCNYIESKNFNSINFLNCKNCKKFVGILYYYVCINCFGKYPIIHEEKNLFNFFLEYKKTLEKYQDINYLCKICNKDKFRCQYWFFEELTFYK